MNEENDLKTFVEDYLIDYNFGIYNGMIKPSLDELFKLKNLCEIEIIRRMK